jgi:DNA polymerase phi
VSNASPTEKDLSNKATSILRTRLSQAKDVPSTADAKTCSTILNEIHAFARRAPSIEFSQICSSCSIFVFRTLDASAPTSNAALDAYRATLTDYMSRKTSSVHPVFINDLLKRYPVRAFPLAADLLRHAAGENVKKLYNQTQAYSMLTFFSQQLNTLSKALPRETVIDFVRSSVQTTYTLLEKTPAAGSEWDASRIREVIRFALHLARSSKAAFGEEIIAEVWDTARLDKLVQAFQTEERTANMKGVQNDIRQLKAVLVLKADKEQTKKGKKLQKRKAGEEADEADKMDLDEPEVAPAKETKPKAKKAKANGDAPAKKRKVKAEKAEKAKAE